MTRPTDTCRLCHNERELSDSHVKSEFLYKALYDDKHRYVVLDTDENTRTPRLEQKGLREYLLCEECEGRRLQPWETYASELFFGGRRGHGIQPPKHFTGFEVDGVQYAPLKLFSMSILWRASISKLEEFREIALGSKHEEKLRVMLLAGDPGEPRDYAVTLIAPREPEEVGCDGITRESMILPETVRHGAERQCRFMMAGLFWWFRVSSHRGEWTSRQEKFLSLRNDGKLRIFDGGEGSKNLLLRVYQELGMSAAKNMT